MKFIIFLSILFFSIYGLIVIVELTYNNLNFLLYFLLNCLVIFGLIKIIDFVAKKLDEYD